MCTVIADEDPVTEEKQRCTQIDNGTAGLAEKTVYVPSIARW